MLVPSRRFFVLSLGLVTACGDSGSAVTAGDTTTATTTASSLTGDTTVDTTSAGMTGEPTTGVSGTEGATESGSTTAATTDSPTTTESVETTGTSTTGTTDTTGSCACNPGDVLGCDGDQVSVCGEDCQPASQPCPTPGEVCEDGVCVPPGLVCTPGKTQCNGDAVETCNMDGSGFDPPVPCGAGETCTGGKCLSACELLLGQPSSIGCSFFANRMDNYDNSDNDSLVVGNTSKMQPASVQLYLQSGGGAETPVGAPAVVPPGGTYSFTLAQTPFNKVSGVRKGGTYRVESDYPIIAYQHSPIGAIATNDASMLLPEHALRQNYVVASYKDWLSTVGDIQPSYFNVVAVENGTTVTWTPSQQTLAGNGVAAVNAGETGTVTLDRGDILQVRAVNGGDLSGSLVDADKPVWVVGAVTCVNVPSGVTYCDHVEEQMLPLDYWGKTYVGAHSPKRGNEKHYWRVYGGEDGVVVSTVPAQPGTPITLNKGEWQELVIANNTSFMFEGTGPFLPVQYLEGQDGGAGTGDPAMYQMIPVEQFLERYAFVTGTGYSQNYVQVIRAVGGADVLVDGVVVGNYYTVGGYEVSDWQINQGAHLAESEQPFGIVSIGYTGVTSYAYPGGMRLEIINPQ